MSCVARDMWKKRYFEEKKRTPPVDDKVTSLRQELEQLHQKCLENLRTTSDTDKLSDYKTLVTILILSVHRLLTNARLARAPKSVMRLTRCTFIVSCVN